MAESEDPADAAARLEQALERIAMLAARPAPPVGSIAATTEPAGSPAATNEIAARLDTLIAHVRATLDHSSEG